MPKLNEAVADFLAQRRIAVAGVSRTKEDAANIIYRHLRGTGYRVFPINPAASTVEGDPCYPDVSSIPEGVDGVVIATRPEVTEEVVRQCAEAGVSRVWMHRSLGMIGSSVSERAVEFCREHDMLVIPGGCPMMFIEPVDVGHKCMRWLARLTGSLPSQV